MKSSRILLSVVLVLMLGVIAEARPGAGRVRPRAIPRAGLFGLGSHAAYMPKVRIREIEVGPRSVTVHFEATVRRGGLARVRLEVDGRTLVSMELTPTRRWNDALVCPVDPGTHTIRAAADQSLPGHQSKNGISKLLTVEVPR